MNQIRINGDRRGVRERWKVSKHPDFEVNEKCEVGDLLIVSPGIDT